MSEPKPMPTYWALAEEVTHLHGQLDKLKDENAKLRELVRTIYMCSNIRCNQCKYGHGNACAFDAETELSELGIEVSE